MSTFCRASPSFFVSALALMSASAVARASDDAGAAAEALFGSGKALMDRGDYAAACPKLAESQRLDPGNGTLARLATCHEKQGRTATAWSEYAELVTSAQRAGQADREKFARQHEAALEPQLSHLTVRVPADAAAIAGLRIRRDETDVGSAAWAVAVPIDPGDHRVEASAPGRKPWSVLVTIGAAADTREVTIPSLEVVPVAAPDAAVPVASPVPPPAYDGSAAVSRGRAQRTWGLLVGGAGVVGLGVGGYFGIRALSDASSANKACPNAACPNAEAVQKNDDAKSNARIADIALPVGLAAVVGGSLLYFLAPKGTRIEPMAGSVNGIRVEASW